MILAYRLVAAKRAVLCYSLLVASHRSACTACGPHSYSTLVHCVVGMFTRVLVHMLHHGHENRVTRPLLLNTPPVTRVGLDTRH